MTYQQAVEKIRAEFPEFRMLDKQTSLLMQLINRVLLVISFGRLNRFMTDYVTTMGTTVYVPDGWDQMSDASRTGVLLHEAVHMRQERRLGKVLYSVMYLCWPLPVLYAVGRRNLEQEAYRESLRVQLETHGDVWVLRNSDSLREWYINQFCGSAYMWTWYSRQDIGRWFDKTLGELLESR